MKHVPQTARGITFLEVVVFVAVVGILALCFWPAKHHGEMSGAMAGALANERSLFQATTMMSVESDLTKGEDNNMHWTTEHAHGQPVATSAARYFAALIDGHYLKLAELQRLLTVGDTGPGSDPPTASNSAFKFFAFDENAPDDQPFVVTANWKDRSLDPAAMPYGKKGFVYFTRSGAGGAKTRPGDVTSTNIFPPDHDGKIYHYNTLE